MNVIKNFESPLYRDNEKVMLELTYKELAILVVALGGSSHDDRTATLNSRDFSQAKKSLAALPTAPEGSQLYREISALLG